METNNQNQQNIVGFAQYESLRIEYEDRIEAMRISQQEWASHMQRQYADDKEKAVKGWKTALMVVCIVFMMFLVGVFGGLYYIFSTYSFDTTNYMQEGSGLNNINEGSQGDVDYGAKADGT